MQEIDDNIYILLFAGIGGMFILTISFILLNVKIQNRLLRQKDREHQSQLLQQEQLLQAIINSQEAERKRIGQDLHDDVGTALSNLRLTIELFSADTENALSEFTSRCKHMIDNVIQDVRHISHNLSPPGIELYGFLGALEELGDTLSATQAMQIHIHNQAQEKIDALNSVQHISLYRVMEELLNNTLRHAQAKQVNIIFSMHNNQLMVTYQDNGRGIPAGSKTSRGMGMHNIESRLKVIAAEIIVSTTMQSGYECQFVLKS